MNYDILSNTKYADMFFYDALDRQVNSTLSDIVVQMLYKGEDHGIENKEKEDGFDMQFFG